MRFRTSILILCITSYLSIFTVNCISDVDIVPRAEWGAKKPVKEEKMPHPPVPFVVIHHSYLPSACYNTSDCISAMKWMQDLHQINNSWNDIGYNFAICGDGRIYEGRGWLKVGAHARKYNDKSIGICLIGDWRVELPPEKMLTPARELIEMGVKQGHIAENYQLVGHRTVREGTECPGDRLMDEIKTWRGFTTSPTNIADHVSKVQYVDNDLINENKLRKRTVTDN